MFVNFMPPPPPPQGPEQATLIFGNMGLTFIPYCLKPIYGFIIDTVTFSGRRFVPHIALSVAGACIAATTAAVAVNETALTWAYFSTTVCMAYALTAVEALATSYSVALEMGEKETNQIISRIWLWYYGGAMVAGLISDPHTHRERYT